MDKPPKSGKGKRNKSGPYADPDKVPAGGRARQRVQQHQNSRGLEDQTEATGAFSESVESMDDSTLADVADQPSDELEDNENNDEKSKPAENKNEESNSPKDE